MTPIPQKSVTPVLDGATIKVTACVLTLNESDFITECLNHLKRYVDYLAILDGCSTDDTVEKAKKIADVVLQHPFREDFSIERNHIQNLAPTNWVLHCDADERFSTAFLKNMKKIILESNVKCFRFPRINLDQRYPHEFDPEDHQIRLLDKRYGIWKRPVHEIVWSPHFNKPLDQCGDKHVKLLAQYPIVHLIRPQKHRAALLKRWKQLST